MKCKKYDECTRETMDGSEYCVLHESFEGKSEGERIELAESKKKQFLGMVKKGVRDLEI